MILSFFSLSMLSLNSSLLASKKLASMPKSKSSLNSLMLNTSLQSPFIALGAELKASSTV